VPERVAVVLPKWGMSMTEATVVEWRKAVGDRVAEGDALVLVETDKVEAVVEAPATGTLVAVHAAVDEDVEVGALLAELET
jgi:pyruvate/2-oxoglutarate dehydrogenase complex dihydrolipoamide acyltransferase (E2) component